MRGEREAEAIWERNQYRDHRRSEEFKEQETSRGQLVLRAQSGADKVREERERAEYTRVNSCEGKLEGAKNGDVFEAGN